MWWPASLWMHDQEYTPDIIYSVLLLQLNGFYWGHTVSVRHLVMWLTLTEILKCTFHERVTCAWTFFRVKWLLHYVYCGWDVRAFLKTSAFMKMSFCCLCGDKQRSVNQRRCWWAGFVTFLSPWLRYAFWLLAVALHIYYTRDVDSGVHRSFWRADGSKRVALWHPAAQIHEAPAVVRRAF